VAEAWQDELGHLFRREAGRMTAALTRVFGARNLPLVEDVVHDALCRALDTWRFTGLPDNPSAWLMTTAKRRAIDVLRREKTARTLEPELLSLVEIEGALAPAVDEAFGDEALRDVELRMMFCCCHARLPEETQIALVLNLLSGFSVEEIAHALFTGQAAMEKRIQRGKAVLAEAGRLPEITATRVAEHVGAVHGALYLLFNEGYHGSSERGAVRDELCLEAIRLTTLLAESPTTTTPATSALLALMCLTAARLPARRDDAGDLVPRPDQDRGRYDENLIRRGIAELERSAVGDLPTPWHIEAAIAYEHAVAPSHQAVNFGRVVTLYDMLLRLRPSPVVALNRAIAVGEAEGPDAALAAIDAIDDLERLDGYPFLAAARAEMHLRAGRVAEAREHFAKAGALARSAAERRFFEGREKSAELGEEKPQRRKERKGRKEILD
jgi:RNA polymerase sigma-70 factor (ECF subfamily)